MPRTLYARLAAVLVGIVALLGGAYLGVTLWASERYREEVDQELNASLADHLAAELPLMRDGRVNRPALEQALHMMMVINPAIEIYLLDASGSILAFSAPPGSVARHRVAIDPIRRFLAKRGDYPILGDDPRHPARRKAFSVAPLVSDGRVDGYLYVVLGGMKYDSAARAFAASYVLRLGAAIVVAAVVVGLAAGLVLFRRITRPVRRLTGEIEAFERDVLARSHGAAGEPAAGDEIERLRSAFERMAGRIREQVETLERTDAERRDLVASVSHDLRTPLAALRGYLDTLRLDGASADPIRRSEYLAIASRHAERLGRLIDDLFELAKLDALRAPVATESFPIAELVQDVVQKFRGAADARGVRLEMEVGDEFPFVDADIGLIERVLTNLVDNGLRHTPTGGTVHVGVECAERRVEVAVEDTGCGIAPDELPHVFDRFWRSRRDDADASGSGLGLAIARRIVEMHGGHIAAAIRAGGGSSFRFDLPSRT